jgi:hypothetical protein
VLLSQERGSYEAPGGYVNAPPVVVHSKGQSSRIVLRDTVAGRGSGWGWVSVWVSLGHSPNRTQLSFLDFLSQWFISIVLFGPASTHVRA